MGFLALESGGAGLEPSWRESRGG